MGETSTMYDDSGQREDLLNATGIDPRQRKRRPKLVCRRKLKSVNSVQLLRNQSLNLSISKEKYKVNNRQLARALERAKQESAELKEALLLGDAAKQELQAELARLRRVAGLRDDEIEEELARRMAERCIGLYDMMDDVSRNMMLTADLFSNVMQKLMPLRGTRASSIGSLGRTSSTGQDVISPNTETTGTLTTTSAPIPEMDVLQLNGASHSLDNYNRLATVNHGKAMRVPRVPQPTGMPDLSMIQEMSYLLDSTDIQFTEEDEEHYNTIVRKTRSKSRGSRGSRSKGKSRSKSRSRSRRSGLHTTVAVTPGSENESDSATQETPASNGDSEQISANSGVTQTEDKASEEQTDESDTRTQTLSTDERPITSKLAPHLNAPVQKPVQSTSTTTHDQDRPIMSKEAPHLKNKLPGQSSGKKSNNLPATSTCLDNSPCNSPYNQDTTEFFGRFVPIEKVASPATKHKAKKAQKTFKNQKIADKAKEMPTISVVNADAEYDDPEKTEIYNFNDCLLAANLKKSSRQANPENLEEVKQHNEKNVTENAQIKSVVISDDEVEENVQADVDSVNGNKHVGRASKVCQVIEEQRISKETRQISKHSKQKEDEMSLDICATGSEKGRVDRSRDKSSRRPVKDYDGISRENCAIRAEKVQDDKSRDSSNTRPEKEHDGTLPERSDEIPDEGRNRRSHERSKTRQEEKHDGTSPDRSDTKPEEERNRKSHDRSNNTRQEKERDSRSRDRSNTRPEKERQGRSRDRSSTRLGKESNARSSGESKSRRDRSRDRSKTRPEKEHHGRSRNRSRTRAENTSDAKSDLKNSGKEDIMEGDTKNSGIQERQGKNEEPKITRRGTFVLTQPHKKDSENNNAGENIEPIDEGENFDDKVNQRSGTKRRGTFAVPLPVENCPVLKSPTASKRARKETIVLSKAPMKSSPNNENLGESPMDGTPSTMSQRLRKETIVLSKAPLSQNEDDDVDKVVKEPKISKHSHKRARKETVVLSKAPLNCQGACDDKDAPQSGQRRSSRKSERKEVDNESELPDIFDEGPSILINESNNSQPNLEQAGTENKALDHTVLEIQDMEFTGVLDPSMLSKIPIPSFVRGVTEPSFLKGKSPTNENVSQTAKVLNGEQGMPSQVKKDSIKKDKSEGKMSQNANDEATKTNSSEHPDDVQLDIQEDVLTTDDDKENINIETSEDNESEGEVKRHKTKKHLLSSTTEKLDNKTEKKKDVSTYFKKPGKMCFSAGRKTIEDIMSSKSGSKSSRSPTKKKSKGGRSKPRLLPSTSPLNASRTAPKGVFDLSLNESIPVPSSLSYKDFREGYAIRQEMLQTAARSHQQQQKSNDNSGGQEVCTQDPLDATVSEHGIMRVLGNGKRTKPRENAGRKSVHYAEVLIDEHLITPAVRGQDKLIPGLDLKSKPNRIEEPKAEPKEKKNAGHTPPRKPLSKTKQKQAAALINEKNQEMSPVWRDATPRLSATDSGVDSPVSPVRHGGKRRRTAVIRDDAESSPNVSNYDDCDNKKVKKKLAETSPVQRTRTSRSISKSTISPSPVIERSSRSQCNEKAEEQAPTPKRRSRSTVSQRSPALSPSITPSCTSHTTPSRTPIKTPVKTPKHPKMPRTPVEAPTEGRRARRAAGVVSYKEISLNQKLRRGDNIAVSIYSGEDAPKLDVYKQKKKVETVRRSRSSRGRQSQES